MTSKEFVLSLFPDAIIIDNRELRKSPNLNDSIIPDGFFVVADVHSEFPSVLCGTCNTPRQAWEESRRYLNESIVGKFAE